jgi:glutaconate CoA-transferase subunit A
MREAIAAHVHDGDIVVIEGFTHLICFAAGHEIIRQRRRNLTLCRLTPDLIYARELHLLREVLDPKRLYLKQ